MYLQTYNQRSWWWISLFSRRPLARLMLQASTSRLAVTPSRSSPHSLSAGAFCLFSLSFLPSLSLLSGGGGGGWMNRDSSRDGRLCVCVWESACGCVCGMWHSASTTHPWECHLCVSNQFINKSAPNRQKTWTASFCTCTPHYSVCNTAKTWRLRIGPLAI